MGDDSENGDDLTNRASDQAISLVELKSCSSLSIADNVNIEILTTADVMQCMDQVIQEVTAVIQESTTLARLLLRHFNWDKQLLLEEFYGTGRKRLYKQAKVTSLARRCGSDDSVINENIFKDTVQDIAAEEGTGAMAVRENYVVTHNSKQESPDLCGICFVSAESIIHMVCGHGFCVECWQNYLKHQILYEGVSQCSLCPSFGCDVPVSDSVVMELVEEENVIDRYKQLMCNSFIASNKDMRWCPSPTCGKVIKAEAVMTRQVMCSCGKKFCFQCGENWHNPLKCSWMRHWNKRCSKDSSTISWLASNTKECPKCGATIEKDGGCNHMICRKDNCLYEFCWVCLGSWQAHGQNAWYSCNRYNEKSSKDARAAMDHSRADMLRFLHYFNRFSNHRQSMLLESQIYSKLHSRLTQIRNKQGQSWNEVSFLKLAADILCQARNILMHSYIFAYFVTQNNQSMIFEDNQRDLELATELLSKYLERDILNTEPDESADNLKQKVNDMTAYCRKRSSTLISHIQEGYDNDWWQIDKLRAGLK